MALVECHNLRNLWYDAHPFQRGARRMNVSIGERWEGFVERIVKSGRYSSASEVVREGLRLVEEREARRASREDRRLDRRWR